MGSHAHEPQFTGLLQLFVMVPHLPARVWANELALHVLRLSLPLRRRPFPCLWAFLRRIRRPLPSASSGLNSEARLPSTRQRSDQRQQAAARTAGCQDSRETIEMVCVHKHSLKLARIPDMENWTLSEAWRPAR